MLLPCNSGFISDFGYGTLDLISPRGMWDVSVDIVVGFDHLRGEVVCLWLDRSMIFSRQ